MASFTTSLMPLKLLLLLASSLAGSLAVPDNNPRIVEHPEDVYVARNEPATLNCKAEGDPTPVITWYRDGQLVTTADDNPLSHRMLLPTGQLFFLRVVQSEPGRRSDDGMYYCKATNPVTGNSAVSREVSLSVAEKPSIVRGPADAVVQENSDIVFRCTASGEPEPTTAWRKEKGVIPAHRSRLLDDRGLKIRKVRSGDEGTYVCRVQNRFGWQEAAATLTVHVPPTFIFVPRRRSVAVGRRVSFECQATGSPTPVISWKKEQSPLFLREDDGRFSLMADGSLVIERVASDDEGEYVCEAQSPAGSAFAKTKLDVRDSDIRPPPIIRHGPQNQTLPISSMAVLQCVVSGDPAPTVRWYKNGHLLTLAEHRFLLRDTGSLQIGELRKSDTGWYTCKALSETGETSSSAALIVETPTNHDIIFRRTPEPSTYPGPPSKATVSDVRPTSVRLAWKENPNNGASVVIAFVVEYFSPDSGEGWTVASDSIKDESFVVRGLRQGTSYRFIVRALNSHGLSLPSPVTGVVKTRGTAVDIKDSNDANPAVINVGGDDGQWSPARGRPGGRYSGVGGRLADVFLQPPNPLGPTSAQLRWDVSRLGAKKPEIDGFHVKYRPVLDAERDAMFLSGPPSVGDDSASGYEQLSPDYQRLSAVQRVTGGDERSFVLTGLQPGTLYAVVVAPFADSVDGVASNTVYLQTSEDVPYAAPSNVQARLLENNTIILTWEPPPQELHNGQLIGYTVYLSSNETRFRRDVWINNTMSELYIHNLDRTAVYQIQISAHNKVGEGPPSARLTIGPSSVRLALVDQPWFVVTLIICVGCALWLAMCVVVALIIGYRRRRKPHTSSKYADGRKPEPVIDPGSASAALQKALSALGHSSAYTSSSDTHTTQCGYADPGELRVGTTATTGSGTESFYEAYIIRPTVYERSTVDSRTCHAREMSSPLQHQYHERQGTFRPIIDAYSHSLSARSDMRSPQNCRQWSVAASYLDDDDEVQAAWTDGGDCNNRVRRHRLPPHQPPAYSHSPPQPGYRRPTPISPAPILRPDNYTLKRPRPAPAATVDGPGDSQYGAVEPEMSGHLLGVYLGEPATTAGGDTTDSGYSLQRSTAPPSPAPLDSV